MFPSPFRQMNTRFERARLWVAAARASTDGWWEFLTLVVKHLNILPAAVAWSTFSIGVGLWVANPWLDSLRVSPALAHLLQWSGGREWPWGLVLCAGGLAQLYSARHDHYRAGRAGAGALMCAWAVIGASVSLVEWPSIWTAMLFHIALAELWIYVRLPYDRRQRELLQHHHRVPPC